MPPAQPVSQRHLIEDRIEIEECTAQVGTLKMCVTKIRSL